GGDCKWGANAAKKVIVSCERIVSRETIGKDPSRTIVPAFKVVAVTEEPFGAHPGYTPGFYDVDFSFGYTYQQASNTEEGFQAFLDEWVFGVKDRVEYTQKYIQKFGYPQFKKLQAKFDYGYPVSYAY
ncbi:MAG TPA: CoA transferase subunit A, partial [Spirochaetota bacterium]|nr:CoA transferase subunit A [Spirochaetota bacterium]